MKRKNFMSWLFLSLGLLCFGPKGHSQGLEDVIVEEYYITDGTEGDGVPAGLTTYRVYVDLAPGYEAQIIFGFTTPETIDDNLGNVIEFATTTEFYNSQFGSNFGEGINPALFPAFPGAAIDTYITMGGAATGQFGVLKSEDTNGSLLPSFTNVPADGIAPSVQDGLAPCTPVTTGTLGLETNPLSFGGSGNLFSFDGNWFNLNGASNPDFENKVLIGQFTTDGEFSFQFSIQILLPGGPGSGAEVYSPVNAILPTGQVTTIFPALKYPQAEPVLGCTSGTACNFNPAANTDDGSCIEPVENCSTCDGEEAVIVDSDGDGICNADEIAGCTSETACNFNPNATDDNFTCLEPVENCLTCNEDNSDLIFVDADNDGICDVEDECPLLSSLTIGDICDDGDATTVFDVVTADCECLGVPVPINDECNEALSLVCGETYNGSTLGSIAYPTGQPFCTSTAPSTENGGVWYSITVDESTNIEFDLSGSDFDTQIYLYTGSCDALICQEGNDNDGSDGVDSKIETILEAGITYNIFVTGSSDNRGEYVLSVTCEVDDIAIFNGSVTWNSNCDDRESTVTFYEPNTSTVAATYTTTVNSAGEFTIADVLIGTYDVIVDVPGFLNKGLADVVTVSGDNSEDFGAIVGGDGNNSNSINVADFSGLNAAFGSVDGDANYNLLSDFNCSGTINIADFSGLNAAFGQGGANAPLP